MKSISLKTYDDGFNDHSILSEIAKHPADPSKGLSIDEIRRSLRVLDALEASPDTLHLEDADHAYLANHIANFRFRMADRRLLDLVERVMGA